jgi:hypothetical protein
VLLDIPTDGSVPRVNPWQLMRRVTPASPDDHTPDEDTPQLTENGIPLTREEEEVPIPLDGSIEDIPEEDNRLYEIEKIIRAEKTGGRYKLLIKWRNFGEEHNSWLSKTDLENQNCNEEVRQWIATAVTAERTRLEALHPSQVEEEPDLALPEATEEQPEEPTLGPISGRLQRERRPPSRWEPTNATTLYLQEVTKALVFYLDTPTQEH